MVLAVSSLRLMQRVSYLPQCWGKSIKSAWWVNRREKSFFPKCCCCCCNCRLVLSLTSKFGKRGKVKRRNMQQTCVCGRKAQSTHITTHIIRRFEYGNKKTKPSTLVAKRSKHNTTSMKHRVDQLKSLWHPLLKCEGHCKTNVMRLCEHKVFMYASEAGISGRSSAPLLFVKDQLDAEENTRRTRRSFYRCIRCVHDSIFGLGNR